MEWGKCSSRQAAILKISFLVISLNTTISASTGSAFVRVPVLSNTMVCASDTASKNFPPLTVMWWLFASRIAERTDNGIASFNAQEKSTIRIDSAFVELRVSSHVRAVPPRLHGTKASARLAAFPSTEDFNFSESSIICTMRSKRVEPAACFTLRVISPSSTAVPAYT